MVKTYEEYNKLLTKEIIKNGYKTLGPFEIDDFIQKYGIYNSLQLTNTDVMRDMGIILRKIRPNKQAKECKVKSYEEYKRLLKKEINKYGNKPLSISAIIDFISKNQLDIDWKITISEVQSDVDSIIKSRTKNNYKKPISPTQPVSTKNKTVKTYSEYMDKLAKYIKSCGGGKLDDLQIKEFIKINNLAIDWKITEKEVRIDSETILKKEQNKDKDIERSALRDAQDDNQGKQKSEGLHYSISDRTIAENIANALKMTPDIIPNHKRIKGLLLDALPNKRMEVNVLFLLVTLGILSEIETGVLDGTLKCRFVLKLENEYATSPDVAERMVLIWFYAYGEKILNKKIDL